jgi:hypothetical protein
MIQEMGTGAGSKWNAVEDAQLRKGVAEIGTKNWKRVAQEYLQGERTHIQCLHRWQKVLQPGLRKGFWTEEEDAMIRTCIMEGNTKWSSIAAKIPGRIGKQIRERWYNHLDPTIKKGGWDEEEDAVLLEVHEKLGNQWREIAKHLPGRTENSVKNRWHSAKLALQRHKKEEARLSMHANSALTQAAEEAVAASGHPSMMAASGHPSMTAVASPLAQVAPLSAVPLPAAAQMAQMAPMAPMAPMAQMAQMAPMQEPLTTQLPQMQATQMHLPQMQMQMQMPQVSQMQPAQMQVQDQALQMGLAAPEYATGSITQA